MTHNVEHMLEVGIKITYTVSLDERRHQKNDDERPCGKSEKGQKHIEGSRGRDGRAKAQRTSKKIHV